LKKSPYLYQTIKNDRLLPELGTSSP